MIVAVPEPEYWKRKTLAEMTHIEWEALCDGCARCCLHKLEDEDTGGVYYTGVVCRYLDEGACRCTNYAARSVLVPECVKLDLDRVDEFAWLPDTCAYRLIAESKPLGWWHPLVSGDPDTVHEAGISVRGRVISDEYVPEDAYEEYIIRWVDQ